VLSIISLSCKTTTPLRPTISVNPYEVVTSPLKIQVNSMGVWYAKKSEKGTLIILNNPGSGDGDEAGEQHSFEVPVRFKP